MNVKEKVAYLKGLMDGITPDETKPEGKILHAIVDTLDTIASEITVLQEKAARAEDYLDELDHDLGELEADFYECEDDDFDEDDDEDDDDEDEYEYYEDDDIDELLELDGATACDGNCCACGGEEKED